MDYKELLEKVDQALKTIVRCHAKPHIRLVRYRKVITRLIYWEKRIEAAKKQIERGERHMKQWEKKKRWYERWMDYGKKD